MLLPYLCTQMSSKRGYRLLKEESQGAAGEEEEADEETSPISRTEGGSTLLADVENQSKPGESAWPLRSSWASEAPRGATAEACHCSVSMACLQLLRWRMPDQASEYASSTRRWVGQADPWYWRARFLSRMRCTWPDCCWALRAASTISTSSRPPSPSPHSRPRSRRWRMCPRRCRG